MHGSGPQGSEHPNRRQGEAGRARRRSVDGPGGGGVGGGGDLLDEELHVYIAAMQLFPIKLNFSFIKNADVKVELTNATSKYVTLRNVICGYAPTPLLNRAHGFNGRSNYTRST